MQYSLQYIFAIVEGYMHIASIKEKSGIQKMVINWLKIASETPSHWDWKSTIRPPEAIISIQQQITLR